MRKENSKLQAQYNVLSRRLDEAMGVLQDIQQRDDNLYRVIFMALTLFLLPSVRLDTAVPTAMSI